MIAIIDYGVGNLFSLARSLDYLGLNSCVTRDADTIRSAERIILPGVGAFGDAVRKLEETGLVELLKAEAAGGKPLLGICLGMQMLLEKSFEFGEWKGLGLIPGSICPLAEDLPADKKVPHIGWNSLTFPQSSPLFKYSREGDYVYFVHSFYGKDCAEHTIALTDYGIPVTAAVQRGNVFGAQFHPEKSGEAGLRILKAFSEV